MSRLTALKNSESCSRVPTHICLASCHSSRVCRLRKKSFPRSPDTLDLSATYASRSCACWTIPWPMVADTYDQNPLEESFLLISFSASLWAAERRKKSTTWSVIKHRKAANGVFALSGYFGPDLAVNAPNELYGRGRETKPSSTATCGRSPTLKIASLV